MTDNVIDPQAWQTLKSMGDAAFLEELIDVYLSDSPQLIEQMRAGLAAGDAAGVRRAAHTLKSNSASLGANRLAAAARDLEMLARSETLAGAGEKLDQIEAEYLMLAPLLVEMKHER